MRGMKILAAAALVGGGALWMEARAQEGSPPAAAEAATCKHGIDAKNCPFCDPSRIERLGMCAEHGVPEALCVECRPYLETAFKAAGDWCAEHATPESQCAICDPSLAAAAPAASTEGTLRYQRAPVVTCTKTETEIRLESPAIAETIGLRYAEVVPAPLTREIVRNAEVAYNANTYARLSSRAPGVIAEVLKDLGETAGAGETIAILDSTELGSAKADLLLALEMHSLWQANAEREQSLLESGAGTQREALEAQTRQAEARIAVSRARQRLRNLGLSEERVREVEQTGDTSSRLEITAPFDGTMVERSAVMGEVVNPDTVLFGIAQTGLMWAMIDLTESDLTAVKPGQEVVLHVDGLPGRPFAGRLTWISTQLDPQTRMIKARAELDNGGALLRANMFGRASIRAGSNQQAVTIPKEAVQWEGCCNIAFVKKGAEGASFQPVRLTLGIEAGDRYEVVDGLSGGESIVTAGSFILKNELLKDAVGAGCCEVDHLAK